ncbi:hypothetical protein [Kluyvera ascorbata]|uniref:hypothetical protein n=1 Tax=Kluyvera ascorbata TaxID=51288 RepID=UPI000E023488|nr:hypothetical protein [Kluyvera ascorbata]STW98036.1 Uncharacterised protein [Kluyvera ascorbata]HBL0735494.1 hypothetical protein [Kluyvera ascorbata]
MAKCRRDNCINPVSWDKDARLKRLCDHHYFLFLTRQENRARQDKTHCEYVNCNNTLSGTKNDKYCSKLCRQLASRKFDNREIDGVLGSSYWGHGQKTIKRSPLMLGSINRPEDIADIYHLYIKKSRHQRSYAIYRDKESKEKFIPTALLELEVCHLRPNSLGGMNVTENLIIGPKLINRRNNNTVPFQGHEFDGVQSTNTLIPCNGSLYDGLVEHFGLDATNQVLMTITPAKKFHGTTAREIQFNGVDNSYPLLTLLYEELWRLGHYKVAKCLMEIKQMFPFYPLYLELLAVIGFHAVLSGDPDRMMTLLCRVFGQCFEKPISFHNPHNRYIAVMYLLLRKYLQRYFSVAIEDRDSVVDFYNGFYSQKIIAPGETEDAVICYRYPLDNRSESSTYFHLGSKKEIRPVELWRLIGEDLTFG